MRGGCRDPIRVYADEGAPASARLKFALGALAAFVAVGLVVGCESDSTLIVQARTDLLPGRVLAAVEVILESPEGSEIAQPRVEADASRAWGAGVRVAEVPGLARGGRYSAHVRALGRSGEVLVDRPVSIVLSDPVEVMTVLLTRDCVGVVCPSAEAPDATACVAGVCVSDGCTEERPELCPPPICASDADCATTTAACAAAVCTGSGLCASAPDHERCDASEVCDVDVGCVPRACASYEVGTGRPVEGEVNTDAPEWAPALSADGLELFFQRDGTRSSSIFVARRSTPEGPFDVAEPLAGVVNTDTEDQFDPSISPDGLTLYYASGVGATTRIYRARRTARDAPFASVEPLSLGSAAYGPDVSQDGLELVYSVNLSDPRLWLTRRASTRGEFSATGAVRVFPRDPVDGSEWRQWGGLSADGSTLYLEQGDGMGEEQVRVASRADRASPFVLGPPLEALGVGVGDPDPTWDGRELYYALRFSDEADIWVAPIVCVPP